MRETTHFVCIDMNGAIGSAVRVLPLHLLSLSTAYKKIISNRLNWFFSQSKRILVADHMGESIAYLSMETVVTSIENTNWSIFLLRGLFRLILIGYNWISHGKYFAKLGWAEKRHLYGFNRQQRKTSSFNMEMRKVFANEVTKWKWAIFNPFSIRFALGTALFFPIVKKKSRA